MEFLQVLENRHSIRNFDLDVDVSPEAIEGLLAAAVRAPSAGNRQPWHFYVVRDLATRRRLGDAAFGQDFVGRAPVVIVVCADEEQSAARYRERGRRLYCLQDTAAAAAHILLAAVDLGLGGCWVGAFKEEQVAQVLGLPGRHRPVAILPIGKPAGGPGARTWRQPLAEVVSYIE